MNIVQNARHTAKLLHNGQMYGNKPYIYHLDMVANNVDIYYNEHQNILIDKDLLKVAAYFHDVYEDTDASLEELHDILYTIVNSEQKVSKILNIIYLVSNNIEPEFKTIIPNMKKYNVYKAMSLNYDAVFIKLCDRIANCTEGTMNKKYIKEMPLFYATLNKHNEFWSMWCDLFILFGDK